MVCKTNLAENHEALDCLAKYLMLLRLVMLSKNMKNYVKVFVLATDCLNSKIGQALINSKKNCPRIKWDGPYITASSLHTFFVGDNSLLFFLSFVSGEHPLAKCLASI